MSCDMYLITYLGTSGCLISGLYLKRAGGEYCAEKSMDCATLRHWASPHRLDALQVLLTLDWDTTLKGLQVRPPPNVMLIITAAAGTARDRDT